MLQASKPILLSGSHYLREFLKPVSGTNTWILDCSADLRVSFETDSEVSALSRESLYAFLKSVIEQARLHVPIEIIYATLIHFGLKIERVNMISMEIRLPQFICGIVTLKLLKICSIWIETFMSQKSLEMAEFLVLCDSDKLPLTKPRTGKARDSETPLAAKQASGAMSRNSVEFEILTRVAILTSNLDTALTKYNVLCSETRRFLQNQGANPAFLRYIDEWLSRWGSGSDFTWVENALIDSCLSIIETKGREIYPHLTPKTSKELRVIQTQFIVEGQFAKLAETLAEYESKTAKTDDLDSLEKYVESLSRMRTHLAGVSNLVVRLETSMLPRFAKQNLADTEMAKLDFPTNLVKSEEQEQREAYYSDLERVFDEIFLSQVTQDVELYNDALREFGVLVTSTFRDDFAVGMLDHLQVFHEDTNIPFGVAAIIFKYIADRKQTRDTDRSEALLDSAPSLDIAAIKLGPGQALSKRDHAFRQAVSLFNGFKREFLSYTKPFRTEAGETGIVNIFDEYSKVFSRLYKLADTVAHRYFGFLDGRPETVLSEIVNSESTNQERQRFLDILQEYYGAIPLGLSVLEDFFRNFKYLLQLEVKLVQYFYLQGFKSDVKIGGKIYSQGDGQYRTLKPFPQYHHPEITAELNSKQKLFLESVEGMGKFIKLANSVSDVTGIVSDYAKLRQGDTEGAKKLAERRDLKYKAMAQFNSDLRTRIKELHKIVQLSSDSAMDASISSEEAKKIYELATTNDLRVLARLLSAEFSRTDINVEVIDFQLNRLVRNVSLFETYTVPFVNAALRVMMKIRKQAETLRIGTLNLKNLKSGLEKKQTVTISPAEKVRYYADNVIPRISDAVSAWLETDDLKLVAERVLWVRRWQSDLRAVRRIAISRLESTSAALLTNILGELPSLESGLAQLLLKFNQRTSLAVLKKDFQTEVVELATELRSHETLSRAELESFSYKFRPFAWYPLPSDYWSRLYQTLVGIKLESSKYAKLVQAFQNRVQLISASNIRLETPGEYLHRLTADLRLEYFRGLELQEYLSNPTEVKNSWSVIASENKLSLKFLRQFYCQANLTRFGSLSPDILATLQKKHPYFPSSSEYYEIFLHMFPGDEFVDSQVLRYIKAFVRNVKMLDSMFTENLDRVPLGELQDFQILFRSIVGNIKPEWDEFYALYLHPETGVLSERIFRMRAELVKTYQLRIDNSSEITALEMFRDHILAEVSQKLEDSESEVYTHLIAQPLDKRTGPWIGDYIESFRGEVLLEARDMVSDFLKITEDYSSRAQILEAIRKLGTRFKLTQSMPREFGILETEI